MKVTQELQSLSMRTVVYLEKHGYQQPITFQQLLDKVKKVNNLAQKIYQQQ